MHLLVFVMRRLIFVLQACCSPLQFWLLVLRLLDLLLFHRRCLLQLPLLLHREGVVVFIVITAEKMDMWMPFATGRRRLRLAVLHNVLVVLVLEALRRVLLLQMQSCSCSFVALLPLHRQELLVL